MVTHFLKAFSLLLTVSIRGMVRSGFLTGIGMVTDSIIVEKFKSLEV
jgi:hypothetical protein